MVPRNHISDVARAWLLSVVLIATLLLAGCAGSRTTDVNGVQRVLSAETDERPIIEVLGVDFDPPLDYVSTVRGQGVTLLVALENRGRVAARNVRVRARLHLGNGEEQVIERQGLVQELPPGQVVVYRFPRLHTLPMRRSYRVDIRVFSADGLQVFAQRTYAVDVQNEQRSPQPARLRAPGR